MHAQKLPESVIIFGCGYVGTALAQHLIQAGCRVGALTRNEAQATVLEEMCLDEVIIAELDSSDWHSKVQGRYQAIVNCVSSAGGGIAGYRKSYLEGQRSILNWSRHQEIRSYVYTSSTSVYPQDGGMHVDESADNTNAPQTAQVLLQSEALLSHLVRWYVLRLAGIYGPGRHFLLNQLREAEGEIPGVGDYAMNMIHLEDIVSAICAALCADAPSGVYNITDNEPTPKQEVLSYLAAALNMTEPIFNPKKVSERLKRRGGRMPHRYISNAKARDQLDWSPKYPSFREGYTTLL